MILFSFLFFIVSILVSVSPTTTRKSEKILHCSWIKLSMPSGRATGNPERTRKLHLARSGRQSKRGIWLILPARGDSHIIRECTADNKTALSGLCNWSNLYPATATNQPCTFTQTLKWISYVISEKLGKTLFSSFKNSLISIVCSSNFSCKLKQKR